ncbi:haloacid dehalogenase type II [Cupriavidus sp. IK-TO18]|uniref:haloacid dehalogenase type II n=1 Tax=unclassified Cupriavidus TaxID=2640874 RepID=UPI0018972984|nr:haloacid dehalogenase type II [Cupriavidus sp. IK-TO18]MBF6989445.1 haloacid dehalogenase type II [Cupriavidus sp. IK-TO18]
MESSARFAVAFDAYGTLFDVHSVAAAAEALYPGHGRALSQAWRAKQLEYSFLRTIADRYADFWTITEAALEHAAEQLGLPRSEPQRKGLMDAYLHLAPFPENLAALQSIRQLGGDLAILSNGSPAMLEGAVRSAGMEGLFTHVLSVDRIRKYKPDPAVYALACEAFGLPAGRITFVSSNGWDVSGAAWFGFKTFWVNRQQGAIERLDAVPDRIGATLGELLAHLRQTVAVNG